MFTPASIAGTVSEFVSILEPEVPVIASAAGADPAIVAKVTAGLDALKQGAADLAAADTTASALPVAQRVVADGQAVLGSLAALPLPPSVANDVRIAQVVWGILPFIVSLL